MVGLLNEMIAQFEEEPPLSTKTTGGTEDPHDLLAFVSNLKISDGASVLSNSRVLVVIRSASYEIISYIWILFLIFQFHLLYMSLFHQFTFILNFALTLPFVYVWAQCRLIYLSAYIRFFHFYARNVLIWRQYIYCINTIIISFTWQTIIRSS